MTTAMPDFHALPQRADLRMMGALELAYLGDTLHDLYVRAHLVQRLGRVDRLHKTATKLVNAAAQARMLRLLWPELTEEEQDVARRGRNAHAHHGTPKAASPADYRLSTGLEALWGYLYLAGQGQRLQTLFDRGFALLQSETEEDAGPRA